MKKIYLFKFICLIFLSSVSNVFANTKIMNIEISNSPPVLVDILSTVGATDRFFYIKLTPVESYVTEWYITNGNLPKGIVLDTNTGEISGLPKEGGTFVVQIKARNESGDSNEMKLTLEISKQLDFIFRIPYTTLRGRVNETFDGLSKKSHNNNDIIYTSDNPSVVSVTDRYILNYHKYGSATIFAKTIENDSLAATSASFPVDVIDPNDATKSYQGIGRFELVRSKADLVDGYYVVASGNKAMNTTVLSSTNVNSLGSELITLNSEVVTNPPRNAVWKISDLAISPAQVAIYNEDIEQLLYYDDSNEGFYYYNFQENDYATWNSTIDTNNQVTLGNIYGARDGNSNINTNILYDPKTNSFKIDLYPSADLLPLQLYRYNESTLFINEENLSKQNIQVVKTTNGIKVISKMYLKYVEVYDLSGKKILSKEVTGKDQLINNLKKSNQLIIIKTIDIKGNVSSSKFIY